MLQTARAMSFVRPAVERCMPMRHFLQPLACKQLGNCKPMLSLIATQYVGICLSRACAVYL